MVGSTPGEAGRLADRAREIGQAPAASGHSPVSQPTADDYAAEIRWLTARLARQDRGIVVLRDLLKEAEAQREAALKEADAQREAALREREVSLAELRVASERHEENVRRLQGEIAAFEAEVRSIQLSKFWPLVKFSGSVRHWLNRPFR